MRRLLCVGLLMLCLSFPVFGGHTVSGGYGSYYCECDNPQQHGLLGLTVENEAGVKQDTAPELGLFLLVLAVLMLRYKD